VLPSLGVADSEGVPKVLEWALNLKTEGAC
jgi:hypothetical protein